jgi:hypothetical protein
VPQTFLFDLDGCKAGKRIPPEDCNVKHGQIRFSFNPNSKQFNFVVADGQYPLHTFTGSSHPYTFIADLSKGTKLKNFLVQSKEESAFVLVKFLSTHLHIKSYFSQDSVLIIWQKAPLWHWPMTATTVTVAKVGLLAETAALAFARDVAPPAFACKSSDVRPQRSHHSR